MNKYSGRVKAFSIGAVVAVVALIFILRLLNVQVYDVKWKLKADNNAILKTVKIPARGLIYDRDDNLIVYNEPAYDLYVTPRRVKPFDTIKFAALLNIDPEIIKSGIAKARDYSSYKASPLVRQFTSKEFASLQESLYKYPGFSFQSRTIRKYPFKSAPHVLGYVGEVSNRDIDRDGYYSQGDYIGKTGIENIYEKELRGEKGVSFRMKDVHNRIKGEFKEGRYDTLSTIGSNLITTLDIDLQNYGEQLMVGKVGGIIAIEPATGEILAMVSTPTFDPSLLVGQDKGSNYRALLNDTLRPLYNRATIASYPPGSTFKVFNTLAGLSTGAISMATRFVCSGKSTWPIVCSHSHGSPVSILDAIQQSCNPYFWQAFQATLKHKGKTRDGYQDWWDTASSFGFGRRIGDDIYAEGKGNLPTVAYYDKLYRGSWSPLTVRSLAIGQGEILCTALQMANFGATVANKGFFYSPHLVKEIVHSNGDREEVEKVLNRTEIQDSTYFDIAIKGMNLAFITGTARASRVMAIDMCGKTGTVQNPHGDAHSVFIAFAPMQDPKISIYVYVEGGFSGSRFAAPIASLMMERYITGEISEVSKWREEKMLTTRIIEVDE